MPSSLCRLLLAASILPAAACAPGPARPVAKIDLVDYTPPAMFRELARGVGVPFVMELPDEAAHDRSDLSMEDVDASDVLEEIVARDARYQGEMRPDVMLYWPTGEAEIASPWSKRVDHFAGKGGLAYVVRELIVQAELSPVTLESRPEAVNRPVEIDARGLTCREILARLAVQAHVGFDIDRFFVRIAAVPE